MTDWLVLGAGGMLGAELVRALDGCGRVTAATRADCDVTDPAATAAAVAGHDVVVNAAAWTDVDGAETAEDAAASVNADGPRNVAAACRESGARLLHVSTDYVFDGAATQPYPEDAPTRPRSAYGRTKLAGEQHVLRLLPDSGFVVRTAWLYGAHGRNFVATMMALSAQRDTVDVVDDQHGQPTWAADLADWLVALATSTATAGIYHATNSGSTTWYGLARAVFEELGLDPARVRPTTTDRFPRPAPRPAYSVLARQRAERAGLPAMRPWREALAQAVPALRIDA
jgi:dTDP-4-dehydrorhamnose reductase